MNNTNNLTQSYEQSYEHDKQVIYRKLTEL